MRSSLKCGILNTCCKWWRTRLVDSMYCLLYSDYWSLSGLLVSSRWADLGYLVSICLWLGIGWGNSSSGTSAWPFGLELFNYSVLWFEGLSYGYSFLSSNNSFYVKLVALVVETPDLPLSSNDGSIIKLYSDSFSFSSSTTAIVGLCFPLAEAYFLFTISVAAF